MPRVLGPLSANRAEREVRAYLIAQLPQECTIVCNVAWALKDEVGIVREGESDFVVLIPFLGMVIVEVKGSRSVRVSDDGVWYRAEFDRQTNRLLAEARVDEAPPEQAKRNMRRLEKAVRTGLNLDRFPGAYAFVVAYPNGRLSGHLDLYDRSTLVTRDEMASLHKYLRVSLEASSGKASHPSFTPELVKRIATFLSNGRFAIQPADTPLDVTEDAAGIEELTRQQYAALRGAFELPSVAITGPAGSGKTMLALWKLAALVEEGKRALCVCFNVALAEHLRLKNPGVAESIESVDRLFARIVGIKPGPLGEAFFREELPMKVLEHASLMETDAKYDAIIVDEGQDFGEERLVGLRELLREGGAWLFFADWTQNVYRVTGDPASTLAEVNFRLLHNCRNTRRTNAATNQYCGESVESSPGTPMGVAPIVERCGSSATMAKRAWEFAAELCPDGGAVFLSPYRLEKSCMAGATRGHGLQLSTDVGDLGRSGRVLFSTIKSFKGLEARHVILLHADIPENSPAFAVEDLYVACTRAIGRLTVLVTSEEAKRWYARELPHLQFPMFSQS